MYKQGEVPLYGKTFDIVAQTDANAVQKLANELHLEQTTPEIPTGTYIGQGCLRYEMQEYRFLTNVRQCQVYI
jgi:hypothetical protein